MSYSFKGVVEVSAVADGIGHGVGAFKKSSVFAGDHLASTEVYTQEFELAPAGSLEVVLPDVYETVIVESTQVSDSSTKTKFQVATDFDGTGATYADDIALFAKESVHISSGGEVKKISVLNPEATTYSVFIRVTAYK